MSDVSYFTIEKFDKCFNLISVNVKMQGLNISTKIDKHHSKIDQYKISMT